MYEALDQWNFVIGAYVVGVTATLGMVAWSWWDMRRTEARRDEVKRK